MTLGDLQKRVLDLLRQRIRSGELTESGLARLVGVSQPHLHHVLSGERKFSVATTDDVMRSLRIDVLDLIDARDWARHHKGN